MSPYWRLLSRPIAVLFFLPEARPFSNLKLVAARKCIALKDTPAGPWAWRCQSMAGAWSPVAMTVLFDSGTWLPASSSICSRATPPLSMPWPSPPMAAMPFPLPWKKPFACGDCHDRPVYPFFFFHQVVEKVEVGVSLVVSRPPDHLVGGTPKRARNDKQNHLLTENIPLLLSRPLRNPKISLCLPDMVVPARVCLQERGMTMMRMDWRHRCLGPILAVGAILILGHGPARAQGVPKEDRKIYARKSTFKMPIEIDDAMRAQLREVRLYVKAGNSDWV